MGLHPALPPGAEPGHDAVPGPPGGYAVAYYRDFVRPAKRFRPATESSAPPWPTWPTRCAPCPRTATAEAIQDEVYAVGKRHPFPALKDWFDCLYQVLLGQQEGPRFGGFVALYGIAETVGADPRRAWRGPPAGRNAA